MTGTVLREELGPKIVIFKFKQKVKYRRRTGHRQDLLRVRIDEISANGSSRRRRRGPGEATREGDRSAPRGDAEGDRSYAAAREAGGGSGVDRR